MSMLGRNIVPVSIVVLAATAWFCRQQQSIARTHAEQVSAQAELVGLGHTRKTARAQMEAIEQELTKARSERDSLLAAVANLNQRAVEHSMESKWAHPPEHWPEWNAASPYVWLPKNSLKRIQSPVWDDTDGLRPEAVALLAIQPEERRIIDAAVRRIMSDWRAAETAAATRSPEHLSYLGGEGEAVTVNVRTSPELAARLRKDLHGTLQEQLGEERTELFEHFAEWRLDAIFGPEKNPSISPKIYSVRREGKLYRIATQGWGSSSGTTGDWRDHIPPHLHPIFAEALKQP